MASIAPLLHTWIGSAAAAAAGVLTEKHLLRTTADWRRDIIMGSRIKSEMIGTF